MNMSYHPPRGKGTMTQESDSITGTAVHHAVPEICAIDDPGPAWLSLISSSTPSVVSKVYGLIDGELRKSVSANVSAGSVETRSCRDLDDFSPLLTSLEHNQCLVYGVPERAPVRLMTDRAWNEAGKPADAISRTERNFRWMQNVPGILMLDHDPQPGMQYQPEQLVRQIRGLAPWLNDVDMLTLPSASSLIFNSDTNECLSPMKGCRVYIMVDDATCVPAVGQYIVQRLWGQGRGVFAVSRSGHLLERGVFDTSVWQPSRIDFAAGAVCQPPLEQRRGHPVLHRGAERMIALPRELPVNVSLVPSLTPMELEAARSFMAAARKTAEPDAAMAAARFAADQATKLERAIIAAGQEPALARTRAKSAVQAMTRGEEPELHGDALLVIVRDGGRREELPVTEVLKRRSEFDGMLTLDPLEPEYNGHSVVGKLFLSGSLPRLHSFAHGGATYKLVAQLGEVEVAAGSLHRTVDETLSLMRAGGDLFDHGDALATASGDGRLVPISLGLLQYVLSSRVAFFNRRLDRRTHEMSRHELDPPVAACKSIFELNRQRELPRLDAVITAPIIVGERLLDRAGYDRASGLLVVLKDEQQAACLASPSVGDATLAFGRLVELFESFPFDTPADRGVLLSALFTSVMRPGLRTAPGFALDAPAQGTGKTLLSECLAIIGTGSAPSALPHLHDDESEVRKRLVSLLYAGASVMIWDNIKGTFDSPVLASLLTSEQFTDRLLGETRLLSLPNRMLALFNGNNMTLRGELTRRILVCRLDAGVERPYLRRFRQSPRDVCLAGRQAIVRDVLTVIRAYQLHGKGFASEHSLGSFEEWSCAVLRPLLWAIAVTSDDRVNSPLVKISMGEEEDDQLIALEALHRPWHARYGDKPITARQVIDEAEASMFGDFSATDGDETHEWRMEMREALDGFMGGSRDYKTRAERAMALGKQLGYRKDRVVDGCRRFRRAERLANGKVALWSAAVDGGRAHV